MMFHVSFNPLAKLPNIQDIRKLAETIDGWLSAVKIFDKIEYNFYDKKDHELNWIEEVRSILEKDLIPEKYKTGAHVLHEQASFMGEDICIYEGHIVTTIHRCHTVCNEYKIVNWSNLFCIKCQKSINENELK